MILVAICIKTIPATPEFPLHIYTALSPKAEVALPWTKRFHTPTMATAAQDEKDAAAQVEEINSPETAVQLAHEADDTKYSPWTKGMFMLYGVLALPYLCGCLNGYDGSLMGGIIAMTSYQNEFDM